MATLPLSGPEKQYGDAKTLDTFKAATKPLPVSGAPAPVRGPGRPTGTAPAATAAGGQSSLPPEHLAAMQQLQKAEQVATYWQNLAQTIPSEYTQMYAKRATQVRDRLALKLYKETPNYL
jgi:hypothetical protein